MALLRTCYNYYEFVHFWGSESLKSALNGDKVFRSRLTEADVSQVDCGGVGCKRANFFFESPPIGIIITAYEHNPHSPLKNQGIAKTTYYSSFLVCSSGL